MTIAELLREIRKQMHEIQINSAERVDKFTIFVEAKLLASCFYEGTYDENVLFHYELYSRCSILGHPVFSTRSPFDSSKAPPKVVVTRG